MKIAAIAFMLLISAVNVFSIGSKQLFVIERNKNANILVYEANILPDGSINTENPVNAYWLLLARDGSREPLSILDKKAYGYQCSYDHQSGLNELIIKSFKDRVIKIHNYKSEVKAEIVINNQPAYLNKIYITANESFPLPKVKSIELFGIDILNSQPIYEKIII